jgi:uncharacterized protein
VILYLDASALVKRYVAEPGTAEVFAVIAQADNIGTGLICRAEVAAAFAKSVRTRALTYGDALECLRSFRRDWSTIVRLQLTEQVVARADALTWDYGLRGYDAVHLASALVWQDSAREPVTLVTFDKPLWEAATQTGLIAYPSDLPALLAAWKPGLYDRTPSANSTPRIHE